MATATRYQNFYFRGAYVLELGNKEGVIDFHVLRLNGSALKVHASQLKQKE